MTQAPPVRRLGIEQLSAFGLPPVDFVHLVADLGCQCMSVGLVGLGYNPNGYPDYSLREDKRMRRATVAAMRERGVAISLGEGCIVRPGSDISDMAADMDILAELGTERLNTTSMEPDLGRTLDQLGLFAEMAAARAMVSTLELCPVLTIRDLGMAVDAVRHVGRLDFTLLLDTMHLGRSGATGADVAVLDPAMIGYVQMCDAPRVPSEPNYLKEATFERMVPGDGEMPLLDYLAAIPARVTISLELPLRTLAEAGVAPAERLRPCVTAARALIAQAA